MRRSSRENEICFENLEQALARSPETYGHIDLLCAGWPCQGSSVAGKRQGFKHKESGLWEEVARCLRLFKPKWFLGENVPGLLSVNEQRDFFKVTFDLQEIGYGISWRILNSQYFGVAQRRKRIFIVGYFGAICPPEILFEQKSNRGNNKKKQAKGRVGLCISTRAGEKHDPTAETIIASTIGTSSNPDPNYGTHFIAHTIRGQDVDQATQKNKNFIAYTIGTCKRGVSTLWEDNYVAQTNTDRKRKTTRVSKGLDSRRGVVIGNAVTVQVAEWIGKRIIEWEKSKIPEQVE